MRLPGSKSITNRTLLLAALAEGRPRSFDVLASDDTRVMLDALRALGVEWQKVDQRAQWSTAPAAASGQEADLFLGNAGTAFRPLTAALAMIGGEYRSRRAAHARAADRRSRRRAERRRRAIDYTGMPGYPPLHIHRGRSTRALSVRGNVSSQFLTGLLMARR